MNKPSKMEMEKRCTLFIPKLCNNSQKIKEEWLDTSSCVHLSKATATMTRCCPSNHGTINKARPHLLVWLMVYADDCNLNSDHQKSCVCLFQAVPNMHETTPFFCLKKHHSLEHHPKRRLLHADLSRTARAAGHVFLRELVRQLQGIHNWGEPPGYIRNL